MNTLNSKVKSIIGGGYDDFWNCDKLYRVCKGSRASKKSKTTALWIIHAMMRYYFAYGVKPCTLVIRRHLNTHASSTRSDLIWAINRLNVANLWKCPKSEYTLTFIPSGQVIYFRGLDDTDNIKSISVSDGVLCWVWW